MKLNKEHSTNNGSNRNDPLKLFIHGNVPWEKSKDEVWEEINFFIDKSVENKFRLNISLFLRYAAAAGIIMLLAFTSFLRFYSKTYTTKQGEHLELILPDGSKTCLNTGTTLKYHPYWWKISRKAKLDGEAFFVAARGKKLEIISERGKTIVLGTSFNILSIDNRYEVTCVNGIVKVIAAGTGDEVVLNQNQKALLNRSGRLEVKKDTDIKESTAWTRHEFSFTSSPLEDVFRKIENFYGVTIKYTNKEKLIYTGYFKQDNNVENILNLVCLAFDIKFEKISDGVYQITNNE